MKNVTIKDVAKAANVSSATVSRALSDNPTISVKTKRRIAALCEEMGYTANYLARSMVKKETNTLGVILTSIDNPFMSELAECIEKNAREMGYSIMLCNSAMDQETELQAFQLLSARQADGMLVYPVDTASIDRLAKYISKVPTVFFNDRREGANCGFVATDSFMGGHMGTEYLYSLGHRNILYFGRQRSSTSLSLRADGYDVFCKKTGLNTRFVDCGASDTLSIELGYHMAVKLFKEQPVDYTAIFACADSMALGVMQAADEFGIAIPNDISLLGFDNIRYSELPKIKLTTVEQPKGDMASNALNILLEAIKDPSQLETTRILQPKLIVRDSCKERVLSV